MSTYNMEKQHKLGKLHALERICMLLDEDSFREIGSNITNLEDAFNIKKGMKKKKNGYFCFHLHKSSHCRVTEGGSVDGLSAKDR